MNQKQMEAVILNNAYIDRFRENSDYKFTKAEEKRFEKAIRAVQDRIYRLAETYYDADVDLKIYGD